MIGRTSTALMLLAAMPGCARSAEDRELDRIFAHQAALRDTTGMAVGVVVEDSSGTPLAAVFVSSESRGSISDSAGTFHVPYLNAGRHQLVAQRHGYEATIANVTIMPPESTVVSIRMHRAQKPRFELEGRWHLELMLDSAGVNQNPSARHAEGDLVLSHRFPSPWGQVGPVDPWVQTIEGLYELDLSPFWGQQVAPDVSTTVFGPTGPNFMKEASAATFNGDSLTIDFIPRISHGGISLSGRLIHRDTAVGTWYQRAYCCGAYGRFRLWRISADPGPITVPPVERPRAPDTLAAAERADIRVRIWDDANNTYIKGFHALLLPDGGSKSVYTTGTEPEGWGRSFWLAPGSYAIRVTRYPCGGEQYSLKSPIMHPFVAGAGERTDIVIRLNTRTARPARTYNNTEGHRCEIALPDSLRSGTR